MGDKINLKIGFIGAGNMARAICEGIVKKGIVEYKQISVSAPHTTTLESWAKLGANTTTKNVDIIEKNDIIFLAIKPHMLSLAIEQVYESLDCNKILESKLFVSILAGVTLESLENVLKGLNGRIIRVMPNTPMMVGEGCTVYCPGRSATALDIKIIEKILSTSGKYHIVEENLINAVGALAGSGPAFIYLVIEAMSDGGVKMGLPRKIATELAAQTVLGAAKMVLETDKHPGTLKDEVCSPGGTTITGIHELEKGCVRSTFMSAIETAATKSMELGQKHKK